VAGLNLQSKKKRKPIIKDGE